MRQSNEMIQDTRYDVVIIGGSYVGLSAAMALGRSLRRVLIIDSGSPCNRFSPHSHNFITHDGAAPADIAAKARAQVLAYDTIQWYNGLAISAARSESGFEITTKSGESFTSRKLLFATGVTDLMPAIAGFEACWGKSILHCPYCHGYEVKHQNIGLIGNGDLGFEFCRMISNWTSKLTLFTNGSSTLTDAQTIKIKSHDIEVVEGPIASLEHMHGQVQHVVLEDGSKKAISAIFAKVALKQSCAIPEQLGCELTEHGLIKVDDYQNTTVPGVYAAGDNATMFRAVSMAIAAGTKAGAMSNKAMIDEDF